MSQSNPSLKASNSKQKSHYVSFGAETISQLIDQLIDRKLISTYVKKQFILKSF